MAYLTEGKALGANDQRVAVVEKVTYLFASEDNKKKFEAAPEKYVPAYGGYCAYGVSVGKKFAGDPEVWKIVDGKLYLNLDTDIQREWEKDVSGHIRKGDTNWPKIKDAPPSNL